jgi:hypothetical protein
MNEIPELAGQPLHWIQMIDVSYLPGVDSKTGPALCGAVALRIGDQIFVARSPLRYRWRNCSAPWEMVKAAPLTLTRCDVEQGNLLMEAIGWGGLPGRSCRWSRWGLIDAPVFGPVVRLCVDDLSVSVEAAGGQTIHMDYQLDLDGSISLGLQPFSRPCINAIDIGEPDSLYRWLRPDLASPVFWRNRLWPTVESAWHWSSRRWGPSDEPRVFKEIYRLWLDQCGNCRQRFANIKASIFWSARPHLGVWIEHITIPKEIF